MSKLLKQAQLSRVRAPAPDFGQVKLVAFYRAIGRACVTGGTTLNCVKLPGSHVITGCHKAHTTWSISSKFTTKYLQFLQRDASGPLGTTPLLALVYKEAASDHRITTLVERRPFCCDV